MTGRLGWRKRSGKAAGEREMRKAICEISDEEWKAVVVMRATATRVEAVILVVTMATVVIRRAAAEAERAT